MLYKAETPRETRNKIRPNNDACRIRRSCKKYWTRNRKEHRQMRLQWVWLEKQRENPPHVIALMAPSLPFNKTMSLSELSMPSPMGDPMVGGRGLTTNLVEPKTRLTTPFATMPMRIERDAYQSLQTAQSTQVVALMRIGRLVKRTVEALMYTVLRDISGAGA